MNVGTCAFLNAASQSTLSSRVKALTVKVLVALTTTNLTAFGVDIIYFCYSLLLEDIS